MWAITHNSEGSRPGKNTWKIILRRNGRLREYPDFGWVTTYVSTGEGVPNEIANTILNDLMDHGFDVEVTQVILAEGAEKYSRLHFYIVVTRLSK